MIKLKMPKESEENGKVPKFSGKTEDFKLWAFRFKAYMIDNDYDDIIKLADEYMRGETPIYNERQAKKYIKFYAKIVNAVDDITARKLQLVDNMDGVKAWDQINLVEGRMTLH